MLGWTKGKEKRKEADKKKQLTGLKEMGKEKKEKKEKRKRKGRKWKGTRKNQHENEEN